MLTGILGHLQCLQFLVMVNLEDSLEDKDHGYDAKDADWICHGIGRCQLLRCNACRHGSSAAGGGNVNESLLRGTKAGGICDGTGHDAHHGGELLTRKSRYCPGNRNGKEDVHNRQEVHLDASAAEGVEEAWTYLQAD